MIGPYIYTYIYKVGLFGEQLWNGNRTDAGGYGSVNEGSHDCEGKICCVAVREDV